MQLNGYRGRQVMPDEQAIYQSLSDIFRETFRRADLQLRPDLSAKDVEGWNSITHVLIIVGVEQRFGIQLSTREIDCLQCVGDLARVIREKAV
jgi:acyl carrier protein